MIHIINITLNDDYTIWTISFDTHYEQRIIHNPWNGTSLKDYIEFRHGNACRSFAGRDGQRQEIILAPFCAEEHTLIHEVTFFYHLFNNNRSEP